MHPVVVPDASSQSIARLAKKPSGTSLKAAGIEPSGEPSRRHRKAAISARVTVPVGQYLVVVQPKVMPASTNQSKAGP